MSKTARTGTDQRLTKADTVALWHAVHNMKYMVRELPTVEGVTPEQIAIEQERLRAAQRALRKVNALLNSQA
jgi:hypothetical protein